VLAELLELAPSGVEEVDGDGYVEYALYGAPGELPAFPSGVAEIAGVRVSVRGEPVADDWAERWKAFHEPVLVSAPPGPAPVWIRPPWAAPREGALDLVIDPGQAFGTGAHPTTRLALELVLGVEPRGSFADLGCGSGVLAIAAARLGFAPVIAVDYEPAALDATRDNASVNGVQLDRIERVNLREDSPPEADVVVANLTRPLLLAVAARMAEGPGARSPHALAPHALVLSGLLDAEADELVEAFTRRAWQRPLAEAARRSAQGWTALLLQ
jgi:ribosomal protein L11 methyltransferase